MKKIREKIRKFRVSEKGFTLIELIVVIAIIGILAAIGTVAYSGYIESANQAADEQLAYDVSYAIQLGAMDEGITGINTEDEDAEDNGYVELTSSGMNLYLYTSEGYTKIELTGSSTGAAGYYAQTLTVDYDALESDAWGELVDGWLTDGVGSSWDEQVLKSDKYTKNEDSDPVKVYIPSGDIYYPDSDSEEKTLSETIAANLTTYSSSSYFGNEESLMESVEGVSDTFGSLVETLTDSMNLLSSWTGHTYTVEEVVASMLGYFDGTTYELDEEWDTVLATYGIELEDGEDLTAEQAGNLTVMYMASLLTEDYTEDGVASTDSVSSLVSSIVSASTYSMTEYTTDSLEELTAMFGAATAYYLSDYSDDDYKESYESNMETLTTTTSSNDAVNAIVDIIRDMNADIDEDSTYYSEGYLASDVASFMSLMSVLTESNSTGDLSLDLNSMSWDSDALSYLQELLDSL